MKPFIPGIRRLQRRILNRIIRNGSCLGLERRAERFVRIFEKHLPANSRILDLGGAWGFYHAPLTQRGHSLTVLDVARPGVQNCPVVLYDGERIPFPDKSFDVTLFITVLHHIHDIDQVVREARRVTRKAVIVVEDIFRHRAGRWWTVLRDQIYNVEFFGHPKNFKKKEDWIRFFEARGFRGVDYLEDYNWLAGLRILNGVFVFAAPEGTGDAH